MPLDIYDVEVIEGASGKSFHDRKAGLHTPGAVIAPMAGRIVKIYAKDGTAVQINDPLLVLEAMKMEVKQAQLSADHLMALNDDNLSLVSAQFPI